MEGRAGWAFVIALCTKSIPGNLMPMRRGARITPMSHPQPSKTKGNERTSGKAASQWLGREHTNPTCELFIVCSRLAQIAKEENSESIHRPWTRTANILPWISIQPHRLLSKQQTHPSPRSPRERLPRNGSSMSENACPEPPRSLR
jgi:hypothetical protein